MSPNYANKLSPIQRTLLIKRKCRPTLNLFNGMHRNIRKNKCYVGKYLKPHQIECERLKEILPNVANCENLDEVKIIQEAIKHINNLEQAVLQRLNIITVETSIENSNLDSSSTSLLPAFIFKLLSSRNNNQLHSVSKEDSPFQADFSHHNHLNNNYFHGEKFLSKSYEYLNSNGSTPYQTDDDIDQIE
ncbi:hypothetical protein EWB00_008250 [Schistosoma japonicum]|uniref:BHLH domain-containing protein n=1 Tax=Schistosoma japonicum TaxID=6182 RepID=A0A4Z2CRP0_SCHJA|nr:hypothetical protein KSF78_0006155 [Schistosoma japonicum]TNN06670.1 hypothetical protein EWB00_008250 [Schistosoma japonicum]